MALRQPPLSGAHPEEETHEDSEPAQRASLRKDTEERLHSGWTAVRYYGGMSQSFYRVRVVYV